MCSDSGSNSAPSPADPSEPRADPETRLPASPADPAAANSTGSSSYKPASAPAAPCAPESHSAPGVSVAVPRVTGLHGATAAPAGPVRPAEAARSWGRCAEHAPAPAPEDSDADSASRLNARQAPPPHRDEPAPHTALPGKRSQAQRNQKCRAPHIPYEHMWLLDTPDAAPCPPALFLAIAYWASPGPVAWQLVVWGPEPVPLQPSAQQRVALRHRRAGYEPRTAHTAIGQPAQPKPRGASTPHCVSPCSRPQLLLWPLLKAG